MARCANENVDASGASTIHNRLFGIRAGDPAHGAALLRSACSPAASPMGARPARPGPAATGPYEGCPGPAHSVLRAPPVGRWRPGPLGARLNSRNKI